MRETRKTVSVTALRRLLQVTGRTVESVVFYAIHVIVARVACLTGVTDTNRMTGAVAGLRPVSGIRGGVARRTGPNAATAGAGRPGAVGASLVAFRRAVPWPPAFLSTGTRPDGSIGVTRLRPARATEAARQLSPRVGRAGRPLRPIASPVSATPRRPAGIEGAGPKAAVRVAGLHPAPRARTAPLAAGPQRAFRKPVRVAPHGPGAPIGENARAVLQTRISTSSRGAVGHNPRVCLGPSILERGGACLCCPARGARLGVRADPQ